jgi:hypothetical protein
MRFDHAARFLSALDLGATPEQASIAARTASPCLDYSRPWAPYPTELNLWHALDYCEPTDEFLD